MVGFRANAIAEVPEAVAAFAVAVADLDREPAVSPAR